MQVKGVRVTAVDNNIKKYQGLTAVFLFLILAGCLVGIIVPAGPGWDFANFYDTGQRVASGQINDLYKPESLIGGEQPQGNLRFWGAPISALLYAPLSYFSPLKALIIFKIQNTLAFFAALLLLYLHNRKFVETTPMALWRFAATFAFVCLIYQPFWTIYRTGGQTTPTVFLLLTLALLSHTRGRFFMSALFVTTAILIKPAFVTLFLFLALISGVQFLGGSVVVLSLAGVASLSLMGWSVHKDFLALMLKGASAAFPWFYNSSLYVPFVNLRGLADPVPLSKSLDVTLTLLQTGTKLLVAATFVYLMIKSRGQKWLPRARRHFNFLMALSFCLLTSQVVWEHYLSVLFLLLAYVVATSAHFSRRAMVLVGAIFVLSMGQNLIFINFLRYNFSFDSPLELLFIGLFKSGPLLLTLIFLWRHHEELFHSYARQGWATYQPEETAALLNRKGEIMETITDPLSHLAEAAINNSLVNRPGSKKVKVVLFSGGRGSRVLSKQLINNPQVALTLAINGYDDGASTGEVRRFLGNSLGPSDFRKNASRMAGELQSCSRALVELLDLRFPVGYTVPEALASFRIVSGEGLVTSSEFQHQLMTLLAQVDKPSAEVLARKLSHFEDELQRNGRPFSFSDCSIGNLVFAGCFLEMGRDFNRAIANYCAFLNLPPHLIENVTDGADAHLVAVDRDNRLLGSEADIVDANKRNHIKDIYLLEEALTEADRSSLSSKSAPEATHFLDDRSIQLLPNPRLLERIAEADLIIYSPGTQHSSLFPSYLTPGLGTAIARNLPAIKLLITNIEEDAEIPDSSAVDIIDRAVFYLKEKDLRLIPTPCLITHYLINDNSQAEPGLPYIPLGRLESLEDPRLVRIGNYEEGITGCHDAEKVLTPFIESFLKEDQPAKIAVLLLGTHSLNKLSQTMLEMLRGKIHRLPVAVTVFYLSEESIDPAFTQSLPFEVFHVPATDGAGEARFLKALKDKPFDYAVLFESSGMYKGEDIVNVAELLNHGRLDAVWGSRRLSVKDIHQSYLLRYRHKWVLGALSYLGSHLLSLAYLLLYGRYISDALSGVRAIRASYLRDGVVDLDHQCVNQHILSALLRDRAEIFETPVQFFSLSPEKVRRTTVLDGLQSLFNIVRWRFEAPRASGSLQESGSTQGAGVSESHILSEPQKPIAHEAASSPQ